MTPFTEATPYDMDQQPEKPATRRVIYGGRVAEVASADGVTGILCRATDGKYVFRVYRGNAEFDDYRLLHDDIRVTIAPDALASFYKVAGRPGDEGFLDHRPETFGLTDVDPEKS